MNRSLLLAAVATLASGAALAQSSVQVYGRFNTSIEKQNNFTSNSSSNWVMQNNGSRLGFKGVEDLGGGLKAGFVLEHRFNSNNGASTNGNAFWGGAGTSEVYLGGNFGTVRLGHFTSEAYFATSDATDLLNHGTGTSSDALYKYLGNDNNKVAYRTPAFGPVTAEFAASAGDPAPTPRIYDIAVNYAAGPFGAGFGYENVKNGDSQFAVRGSYETGPFLVTGYVQRYKSDALSATQSIYRVSGMYTVGAVELHLAFGGQGDIGSTAAGEASAKQFTTGANYNLSKRTKVFAFFNKVKTDATTVPDPRVLSVGVRHNF